MSRFLELTLAFIGIGVLVCTLIVLTNYSITRVVIYIKRFKESKGKGMKFSDYVWLLFRIALSGLFLYDRGIFFVKIYDLVKGQL